MRKKARPSPSPRPSRPQRPSRRVQDPLAQTLAEQRDYYRARAGEYEDWWLRRGRYDHGPEANAKWFAEARHVQGALERFAPAGRILELACGTGLWSERLAPLASKLTALDSSSEVLAIAREKVSAGEVEWLQADLFEWEPSERYDVCFFGFWLSHVPAGLLASFWAKVERSLAPGGRVFLVDSALSDRATARDHEHPREAGERVELRRLADGREFRVVKHWFDASELQRSIERQRWRARIRSSGEFFVYGEAVPGGPAEESGGPAEASGGPAEASGGPADGPGGA